MTQIAHMDIGDVWVPQATFTVNGTPTDPTTITVKTMDAAGAITTIGPVSGGTGGSGIVRVSAGVFNTLVPLTAGGYWYAEFIGTGTAAATEWHEAIVDPSPFASNSGLNARALVGLGETKDWLQAQQIDTTENLEIVRAINDASDRMFDEADREFKVWGTNPQTRVFEVGPLGSSSAWFVDGDYQGQIGPFRRQVKVGDLTSFTQVRILDRDWTTLVEDITPLAKVAGLPLNRKPWEPIRTLELHSDVAALSNGMRLEVTGTWGFPTVPGNVRQAVLDAVAATLNRDVEHYREDLGVGAVSTGQSTIIIPGGSQRMLSMPPSSLAVAWYYRDAQVG